MAFGIRNIRRANPAVYICCWPQGSRLEFPSTPPGINLGNSNGAIVGVGGWRDLSVCLFVCLSICLSVSLFLSLCLSFSFCPSLGWWNLVDAAIIEVCLSFCLSLPFLSLSLSLFLSRSLSLSVYPCLSLSLYFFLSLCLYRYLFVSLSLYLSLWQVVHA